MRVRIEISKIRKQLYERTYRNKYKYIKYLCTGACLEQLYDFCLFWPINDIDLWSNGLFLEK